MVEPIRQRVVTAKGWLNQKEFLDGLALCQMVPGATVVQLATYVGYRLGRTPGALATAAAFILPAFVLMLGLSALYFTYGNIAWVKSVSRGLGVVVIALLLQAVWHLGRNVKQHALDVGIALSCPDGPVVSGELFPGLRGRRPLEVEPQSKASGGSDFSQ